MLSLDAFAILSPCLGEVFKSLDPELAKKDKSAMLAGILQNSLGAFRDLPKLAPFFFNQYQCYYEANGDAKWVSCEGFKDEIFAGKSGLLVAWLIAAIHGEYIDFLVGNGSTILKDLGKVFGLQATSKEGGQSGG